jgi:hypothetical protein
MIKNLGRSCWSDHDCNDEIFHHYFQGHCNSKRGALDGSCNKEKDAYKGTCAYLGNTFQIFIQVVILVIIRYNFIIDFII